MSNAFPLDDRLGFILSSIQTAQTANRGGDRVNRAGPGARHPYRRDAILCRQAPRVKKLPERVLVPGPVPALLPGPFWLTLQIWPQTC